MGVVVMEVIRTTVTRPYAEHRLYSSPSPAFSSPSFLCARARVSIVMIPSLILVLRLCSDMLLPLVDVLGRGVSVVLPSSCGLMSFFVRRAAEDAVASRHGHIYRGRTLRVEFTGQPRNTAGYSSVNPNTIPPGGGGGGGGGAAAPYHLHGGGGMGGTGGGGSSGPRKTGYRAIVSYLPPGCRWQDLKDHMRRAGPVIYAEVFGAGRGVVEFEYEDDLRYAVRTLDKTELRVEGRGSIVKVRRQRLPQEERAGDFRVAVVLAVVGRESGPCKEKEGANAVLRQQAMVGKESRERRGVYSYIDMFTCACMPGRRRLTVEFCPGFCPW